MNNSDCSPYTGCSFTFSSPNLTPHTQYTKGILADLKKYHWFYGNITEEQTKAELNIGIGNIFLVQHNSDHLIISFRIRGWDQHTAVHYSPEGYCLEGKDKHFRSIPEMIAHYQKYPIEEKYLQVLGRGCDRRSSGTS